MKELWILTERSDFDLGGRWDYQNYRSGARAFSSFEAAKKAMRRRITEIASEGNSMLPNGKIPAGTIKEYDLAHLINSILSDPEFTLDAKRKKQFIDDYGISTIDTDFNIDKGEGYTNYMYGFGMTDEEEPQLICHGHVDGPINGVNPYIFINCFIMNDPNMKYSFHMEDEFDDNEFLNHLFLDLEKVEVED